MKNTRYKWMYIPFSDDYDYHIIDMIEGEVVFSSNSPYRIAHKLRELNNE